MLWPCLVVGDARRPGTHREADELDDPLTT